MRAFIAVELSDELKQKLEALGRELEGPLLRPVGPENLHMTLVFLGDIDEGMREKVVGELKGISAKPFTLTIRGAGVFPNENFIRVVWAGAESGELAGLQKQIAEKMHSLGFKREQFSPHITIARAKGKVDVGAFLSRHAGEEFGSCTVDRVLLKKSALTPKGAVYEDVYVKVLG